MITALKTIGFEIEGEFSPIVLEHLEHTDFKAEVVNDGSIRSCCDSLKAKEIRVGVYNNEPEDLEEIKKLFSGLDRQYKVKNYHFNNSMGFHIHLGFAPKVPPEILFHGFANTFLKEMKREYPDELKTRRKNRYCRVGTLSDAVIEGRTNRYRAINFRPSLQAHGTVEFRIYPSNEPLKMYNYLLFTLRVVEDFLKLKHKTSFVLKALKKDTIKENLKLSVDLKGIQNIYV